VARVWHETDIRPRAAAATGSRYSALRASGTLPNPSASASTRRLRYLRLGLVVEKGEILDEIRRCAERNGGVPLGWERFRDATGIAQDDWLGRYWVRWGDAIREAGFEPNILTQALDGSIRSCADS
jgi:hypothetical protein